MSPLAEKKTNGTPFRVEIFCPELAEAMGRVLGASFLVTVLGAAEATELTHRVTSIPRIRLYDRMPPEPADGSHFMVISPDNEPAVIQAALAHGAVDYLLPPVDHGLLAAKIRHFFFQYLVTSPIAEIGMSFDFFTRVVRNEKGESVDLTFKQSQILQMLCQAFPKGVTRENIQKEIWREVQVIMKTFDVHLFTLRRKLETIGYEIHFNSDSSYSLSVNYRN